MGSEANGPSKLDGDSKAEVVVQMSSQHAIDETGGGPKNVPGMRIIFKDLNYVVKSNKDKKKNINLLTNVNGFFEPGEMAALMGPSGSGKTTLLDVLAGRKTIGTIQGEILFAGAKPTVSFLRRYTGYVEQFDTLLPILTVEEMLMYTAELKRPLSEPFEEKKQAVEEVIEELALKTCRGTMIGDNMHRGISGGQAKRVNIGISLVTQPRVLFLDEPTSGLDSYTSNEVMTYVKALAKQGITVCATIHSPTSYAFGLFDRLMLLLRGQMVYFGMNGKPAIEYFEQVVKTIGVDTIPEEATNPAEWIVDLTTKTDRQDKYGELADAYSKSDVRTRELAILDSYSGDKCVIDQEQLDMLQVKRATVTPTWWAFVVMFKYRTMHNYKSPEFLGPRLADKFIFSILIFTLYIGIGNNYDVSDMTNIAAMLFMWVTLPAFGAAAYIPSLVLERPLYVRERSDGLYRSITYLGSKIFEELLVATAVSAVVAVYTYFAVALQGNYAIFWLAYLTTLSCGIVLAYLIASLSPTIDVANAALPTYVVTLLFFGGFLIRKDDIRGWWIWYSYLDFLKYGWGALMHNQFNSPKFLSITYLNGENILDYYGLTGISPWGWLAIETCFLVVFFMATWVSLEFVKHQRR